MRTKILFILLVTIQQKSFGQLVGNFEVGGFFGISNYMGDLHTPHFEVLEIHPAIGVFTRYNFNSIFSLKANFYQGKISGNDANYPTIETIRNRNLSFRSAILEGGIQLEVSLLRFGIVQHQKIRAMVGYLTTAYVFGGVSGFYFKPQTKYMGRWYDLQPLGTEGQGIAGNQDKYKLFQFSLPMGFGFKIQTSPRSCLGFEIGLRKTFTDYLDDVSGKYPDLDVLKKVDEMAATLSYRSRELPGIEYEENPVGKTRGNSKGKDMYFFGGITVSVGITK
jgi:hypothetical protein